jgi:hypothetical protein
MTDHSGHEMNAAYQGDAKRDAGEWRNEEDERLSAFVWAGLFLWAGVSLLLAWTGVYDEYRVDGWVVSFVVVSAILVGEILVRWAVPTIRQPQASAYMGAGVAIGIALGAFWVAFAAILLGIGVSILVDTARTTHSRPPGASIG